MGAQHGDDSARLRAFLAEHDEPCPDCGYNLRGLTTDRCPECRAVLVPTIRERIGARRLLALGAALALNSIGFGAWFTIGALHMVRSIRPPPGGRSYLRFGWLDYATFSLVLVAAIVSLVGFVLLVRRCRRTRREAAHRVGVAALILTAILGSLATIVPIALD